MSRYQTEDGQYAWGYDEPLQEYFYQKFDLTSEEEEWIFSIGTGICEKQHPDYPEKLHWSRGELLELMDKDGIVPEYHRKLIALDLPIQ
jgi:hypothetical protein